MSHRKPTRRGAVIHETVAATLMAMLAIAGVAQLLAIDSRQWIAAQQRATAVREAGNLMEDLFSRPWSELSPGKTQVIELPETVTNVLPEAHAQVTFQTDEAAVDAVQILIQIDWRNVAGQRAVPVRLSAWKKGVRHLFLEATP